MNARHAIRTYLSSVVAAERLGYRLATANRGWQAGYFASEHPRLAELKRGAFKAMLKEYSGTNMHYKRQLRLAALGIPDGGTPPLWSV
jgi:hypothetical protein